MPVVLPSPLLSLDVRVGDCRELIREMPDESVQCCVTSPPYFGLRDYGHPCQIGQEETPESFVAAMVEVFREVRRVLKADGTCWLNLGDSYANDTFGQGGKSKKQSSNGGTVHNRTEAERYRGIPSGFKRKDLMGIPWRVAFALQADGWYLRQDIIWAKPNPMPESVTDRCTKSHEYIFLLSKSEHYFYDHEAIKEQASGTDERPQQRRAKEIAKQHGLTSEHFAAIRSCGVTDAGKAQTTQNGHGRNTPETMALADHAKRALGGYYREFLMDEKRYKRSVWNVQTFSYPEAHFATYPPDLIKPCIMAGTKPGDVVLDPFGGSGTTGQVALELGRRAILCELNPAYAEIIHQRTNVTMGLAL